jgi:hypothetical protein
VVVVRGERGLKKGGIFFSGGVKKSRRRYNTKHMADAGASNNTTPVS